jgi:hypothetical protein
MATEGVITASESRGEPPLVRSIRSEELKDVLSGLRACDLGGGKTLVLLESFRNVDARLAAFNWR